MFWKIVTVANFGLGAVNLVAGTAWLGVLGLACGVLGAVCWHEGDYDAR
jgi:hypothetical protein